MSHEYPQSPGLRRCSPSVNISDGWALSTKIYKNDSRRRQAILQLRSSAAGGRLCQQQKTPNFTHQPGLGSSHPSRGGERLQLHPLGDPRPPRAVGLGSSQRRSRARMVRGAHFTSTAGTVPASSLGKARAACLTVTEHQTWGLQPTSPLCQAGLSPLHTPRDDRAASLAWAGMDRYYVIIVDYYVIVILN